MVGANGWVFLEELMVYNGDIDVDWLRSMYNAHVDVATTFVLAQIAWWRPFDLIPFINLSPWLERQVMGSRNGYGELHEPPRRGLGPSCGRTITPFHNMDQELQGLNYPSS